MMPSIFYVKMRSTDKTLEQATTYLVAPKSSNMVSKKNIEIIGRFADLTKRKDRGNSNDFNRDVSNSNLSKILQPLKEPRDV